MKKKNKKKNYKNTVPGTVKSRMIFDFIALNKTVLRYIDWNKAFRLTVEYEPEMQNSHVKIEYD